MTYKILSLDGGGVKGVLTAILLKRLETHHPGFLEQIDLFAGTSTGGILALGLAAGLTTDELIVLYRENAAQIFADSVWDDIRDLGRMLGADYDSENLEAIVTERFGDKTLGDLDPKRVLISSFDLDPGGPSPDGTRPRAWKPKFFHNFGTDPDRDERVADVAMRTSAAPTYFPSYQGYVDGGVAANNPSVCALSQALDADTGGQSLVDIVLLSMGTGVNPIYIQGDTLDWGYVQWGKRSVYLFIEGSMKVADYQCERLLDDRYKRLDPVLPERIDLDAADKVGRLVDIANGSTSENSRRGSIRTLSERRSVGPKGVNLPR